MIGDEQAIAWEHLLDSTTHQDCTAVDVDSNDNVYVLTRGPVCVITYSHSGERLRSWGETMLSEGSHGLCVGADHAYCVDQGEHCVRCFDDAGNHHFTIGTPRLPSNTGYSGALASITGGPPFNRPTAAAVSRTGDLYVADGYGNCKVHRFSPEGTLIQSWGQPGSERGRFQLPHGVAVLPSGDVLVADRENERIQIFSPTGSFLDQWTNVQRPTSVAIDTAGNVYVSELPWLPGEYSYSQGLINEEQPGGISKYDGNGRLLLRIREDEANRGRFVAPHDLAVNSHGDVYVADVRFTFCVSNGIKPAHGATLHKLVLTKSSA